MNFKNDHDTNNLIVSTPNGPKSLAPGEEYNDKPAPTNAPTKAKKNSAEAEE